MNPIIVLERSDRWLLRVPGQVFPIMEAAPAEVVQYIRQNFTGRGRVELHRASGEVEVTKVSALVA
jgi:hypothetical protein